MSDVFVLGSINQDFVLKVERRPEPGETVTNAELSTHNGGKGANQAAAAALLGASVVFLGRVGDDEFGEPLVQALEEKGIDTILIKLASGTPTGAACGHLESQPGAPVDQGFGRAGPVRPPVRSAACARRA